MKAVLCKAFGPPESLVLEELPSPSPGKGQIVVTVKACSANFPDALIIQDKYQFKPKLPFSPGAEIGGIVKAVGEGVTAFKGGERILASIGWGGFAEEVAIDADRAYPIPDKMSYEEGSAFLMAYGTSYHALKDRAVLKPGESLLVMGAAGGVGLTAVELGAAMGAKVVAAASSEQKVEVAKSHGATAGLVYPSGEMSRDEQKAFSDAIKAATGGQGADVIYDPVGGAYAEPAFRAIAWKGRYLVIGFAAGDIPRLPLNLPLLKGASVVGVFWGQFAALEAEANRTNVKELLALYEKGAIKPHISARYPLAKAGQAIRDLMDRKATGKIVVTMGA
ncbi:MAG: NADPH:quinone oxidoreductase family protein [Alphaproteobacteria bacterium]|nr:NADPH:quinone oxidoreductase family protein [Alphaproteobacteria bacterium]